jgi:hypothetical protein
MIKKMVFAGHSADLALESDVSRVGILPSSFAKVVVPGLHTLGHVDYTLLGSRLSLLCGLFFWVPQGRTLIGVYAGRDTKNIHLSYPLA